MTNVCVLHLKLAEADKEHKRGIKMRPWQKCDNMPMDLKFNPAEMSYFAKGMLHSISKSTPFSRYFQKKNNCSKTIPCLESIVK